MSISELAAQLAPILNSKAATAVMPVIVSSILGSSVALFAYRFKSREPLTASITWQWTRDYYHSYDESPYLTVQNRSTMPAYLKRARILRGNFFRRETHRYAFSYAEPDEGNFPLEVKASGISSFPMSFDQIDNIMTRATLLNKAIGYLLKRPYVWIEVHTLGGGKIIVPANDASSFQQRPLWIEMRWWPAEKPDWLRDWENKAVETSKQEDVSTE